MNGGGGHSGMPTGNYDGKFQGKRLELGGVRFFLWDFCCECSRSISRFGGGVEQDNFSLRKTCGQEFTVPVKLKR